MSGTTHNGRLYFSDSGQEGDGFVDYDHQFGNLKLGTRDITRFTIDSSGRVLLGTGTVGDSGADDLTIETSTHTGITVRSGTTSKGSIYFSDTTAANAQAYVGYIQYNHGDNSLTLATNTSQKVRIDSSGNTNVVGILTAQYLKAYDATQNVIIGWEQSARNVTGSWNVLLGRRAGEGLTSGGSAVCIGANAGQLLGSSSGIFIGAQAGSKVTGNGNVFMNSLNSGSGHSDMRYNTSSNQVFYDSSSRLVKTDIEDLSYGLDAIKQLKPRIYKRTDTDGDIEVGFIADEVVDIIPEIVPKSAKSLFTKNEEDTEIVPSYVEYKRLTAVLTKAVQELSAEVEQLKSQLNN